MSEFTISEIARRVGLRPSAIRYYEQLGILPPALRRSGQRRYNDADLYKLTVVQPLVRRVLLSMRSVSYFSAFVLAHRPPKGGDKCLARNWPSWTRPSKK